ncbi:uncharacterized protein LOC107047191 [Diachasma alloeum]|nr:uncharacterized protein LOC107047191 [Diachasma alloeum]
MFLTEEMRLNNKTIVSQGKSIGNLQLLDSLNGRKRLEESILGIVECTYVSHPNESQSEVPMLNWKTTRWKFVLMSKVIWITNGCQQYLSIFALIMASFSRIICIYVRETNHIMPRLCCVAESDAIQAVVEYIDNFRTNEFPTNWACL